MTMHTVQCTTKTSGPWNGYNNLACGFGGSLPSFCVKLKERYAAESLAIQHVQSHKKNREANVPLINA
jgi:hypothetical protein